MIYKFIKKTTQRKFAIISTLLLCTVSLSNSPAMAGSKVFAFFGRSLTLNGTTETTSNGNVDPFVIETFSAGNECLRIAVTSQPVDLEATLVSPDGRVWRDDDSGGSLRPLIKAITVKRGWHILRLSHFTGNAVNADFTVEIQRVASSNSLCGSPTPPAISFAQPLATKPQGQSTVVPLPGGTQ